MTPRLAPQDPDWDSLCRLCRAGFRWTERAEQQRYFDVGVPKRGAAESFLIEYISARGKAGPVNRTEWDAKDEYQGQVNYEIRAQFDDIPIYVKFCVAQFRRERTLLITSFKRDRDAKR